MSIINRVLYVNQGFGPLSRETILGLATRFKSTVYCGPHLEKLPLSIKIAKTHSNSNGNASHRLVSWFLFIGRAIIETCFRKKYDYVVIVSNPPLTPFVGFLSNLFRRTPYCLIYYDIYPDAAIRFGIIRENGILARIWRYANRIAIRNADLVITISPNLSRQLKRQLLSYKFQKDIHIVPTWVDTDWIKPIPKSDNLFAVENRQVNKLTILYSGNIGRVHDISIIPEVARQLGSFDDVHFVVIGDGVGCFEITKQVKILRLTNFTLMPFQDEGNLPYSLAMGDIGIISLAANADGISMPSKTYYMMAAGTAILGISEPDSDLANLILEYQCGINVVPGDVAGAVRAIVEMRNNPASLALFRQNSRMAAERYFSRKSCVPRLLDLIERPITDKYKFSGPKISRHI
jgi:colanic acid biosynthesis glycosyl transferase WcaI